MYVILVEATIQILPVKHGTLMSRPSTNYMDPCSLHVLGSIYFVAITEITNNIAITMFLKEQN